MAALRALRTMRDRRLGRLPYYEDISPSSRWTESTDGRRVIIDLTGFKKEEVKMEVDESGNVTIGGRHGIGNNRFQRFSLTFKAPEDTEMKGIVGNLEDGLYTVFFPRMAAVEAVQEAKLRNGVEETDEKLEVPEAAAANGTKTVSTAEEETAFKKALELESEILPEADKADKTQERPKVMPQSSIKMDEPGAQEPETFTKPVEMDTTSIINATPALPEPNISSEIKESKTAAVLSKQNQVLETSAKPVETGTDYGAKASENATSIIHASPALPETKSSSEMTAAILSKQNQEEATFTKPAEIDKDYGAKESENATTMIDAAPALREPSSSSEMTEPKTPAILSKEEGKADNKDEPQEHQGIKKGGFLENMMEKINEHKVCIISAILAFSMGILLSRKIRS